MSPKAEVQLLAQVERGLTAFEALVAALGRIADSAAIAVQVNEIVDAAPLDAPGYFVTTDPFQDPPPTGGLPLTVVAPLLRRIYRTGKTGILYYRAPGAHEWYSYGFKDEVEVEMILSGEVGDRPLWKQDAEAAAAAE